MEIVIIGTGNTATILGRKLKAAGHSIVQVFGRSAKEASKLAYELDTESTNYWSVVNRDADIYLLAVSDIAIEEIVKELQLPEKTMVHTAASVSKNVLNASQHFGVFYPLQSLRKETNYLPDIPIIIDASDEQTLQLLMDLASTITDQVLQADDQQRAKLHLAAVFCNNFVNHLYTMVYDYCQKQDLDFHLLLPLIKETAFRLETMNPAQAQTGPAVRGDATTINKHLQLLEAYPEMQNFYQVFTQSIQKTKG